MSGSSAKITLESDLAIEIDRLCCGQGNSHAIEGLSLIVRTAEIVCIVGRSGVGKSTLLRCISGLISGEGKIELRSRPSLLSHDFRLFPWRSVLENVLLPVEVMRGGQKRDRTRALNYLKSIGLEKYIHTFPESLSAGMTQRVSFVRMLMEERDVLLLDEPMSAIDAYARTGMIRLLREHVRKGNRSALVVTHDIEDAIALGDRIYVMSGTPASIKTEVTISLSEDDRTAEGVRRWPGYTRAFSTLWQAIKGAA